MSMVSGHATICCGQEVIDISRPPDCACRPRSCAACGQGWLGDWRYGIHRALGCATDSRHGIQWPIRSLVNPVTRTVVVILPPFTGDDSALSALVGRFRAYCQTAWELGHLDPHEVMAVNGWPA